jgi:hypothetical protein
MHVADRKVNRKSKATRKQSWAEALKTEGIGLDREQEQCKLPTDVRPAEVQFACGVADRTFFPLSANPKRKPKCIRR